MQNKRKGGKNRNITKETEERLCEEAIKHCTKMMKLGKKKEKGQPTLTKTEERERERERERRGGKSCMNKATENENT